MTTSEDILLKFSGEDLLQEALIGLLVRIEGVWDIQLLQGTNERGKDIVFKYRGPLNEVVQCACVVKNTSISGKVSAANAAHTVVQQAKQALLNPYVDNTGQLAVVHRVYVVTPKRITPHAVESIAGELRERSGQIHFIHGDELVRLFQRYWPDYLADEADALFRYVDAIDSSLSEEHEIVRLARLYPDAGISGDLRVLRYVFTDFCLTIRKLDALRFIPTLPREDFFHRRISLGEVEGLRLLVNSLSGFLRHVEMWGYKVRIQEEQVITAVTQFLEALHQWWLTKDALQSAAVEGVIARDEEERLVRSQERVVRELGSIRTISYRMVREVQGDLSLGAGLAQSADLDSLGFPEGSGLFNYLRAVDCINSYSGSYDVVSAGEPVLREFVLSPQELRSYSGLVLVVGPAGYGKTSFCRWSALEDLALWRSSSAAYIPLYVRLNCMQNCPGDIFGLLRVGLHAALLSDVDWESVVCGELPVRLYLDGLDELSLQDDRRKIIELSRQLASSYRSWQIIITMRDYVRAPWLSGIARLSLAGFDSDDVQVHAEALLDGRLYSAGEFIFQLDSQPHLRELCRVPLLATLMIRIFGETGDLPSRRATLYSTFVDLLCGGWDFAKGVQRNVVFGREVKIAILTRLALLIHVSRSRVVGSDAFLNVCIEAAPAVFVGGSREGRVSLAEKLLAELLADGLLNRAGQSLQFSHFSFQEFMVARDLASGGFSQDLAAIVSQYLQGDDWWREVLSFFVGLSADPERLADWIESMAIHSESTKHSSEARRLLLLRELQRAFPSVVAERR
jgi:hypothetical protein